MIFLRNMSNLKDPEEYDIKISSRVKALIEGFDSTIVIKIKDSPEISAQALKRKPAIIVLSKSLFKPNDNSIQQFNEEDIEVLVAHELGHLIPKSNFDNLLKAIIIGTGFAFSGIIISICFALWNHALFFLLLFLALFTLLHQLNYYEEYRADKFAILEANVSIDSFSRCFSKVASVLQRDVSMLHKIKDKIFNFHPSIEKRIFRAESLKKQD